MRQTPVSKIAIRSKSKDISGLTNEQHVPEKMTGESMYMDSQTSRVTEVQAQIVGSVRNKKLTPLMNEIMHLYRVAKMPDRFPDFHGKPLRPLQGAALHSWVANRIGLPKIEIELILQKAELILTKLEAKGD